MKLGTRLGITSGFLVILVVTGLSMLMFISQKQLLENKQRENQINVINGFAQVSAEALIAKNEIVLVNYLKVISRTEGVSQAMLLDMQDRVLAHTDIKLLGAVLSDNIGEEAKQEPDVHIQLYVNDVGHEIYEVSKPVFIAGIKRAVARVGFSKAVMEKEIKKNVKETRDRIMYIALICLLVGLLIAVVLARMMVIPIRKLTYGATQLGLGKLDYQIKMKKKDELGQLAQEFNNMAVKLKELDEMKRDFVSSVTHELRSPMTSIRMYIGLLLKGAGGTLTPKQEEHLNIIKKSTNRLARFIDDLLDISKIESGKMQVLKEQFDILSTVVEVIQLMKPQADAKKIALNVASQAAIPQIQADPERIKQVLTNLLSNSIKFTQEKGKIVIKIEEKQGVLELGVIDDGPGIPGEYHEKVFEKFEQVKGTSEKIAGQKGTGLGLPIVKAIIEMHGGKIRVESEPGKGAAFIFTLPKK